MSYLSYWKKENRLEKITEIMQTVTTYPEAVKTLKSKYGIVTDHHTLSVICRSKKIPRPLISLNHGGDRRSKKFEEREYEYAV